MNFGSIVRRHRHSRQWTLQQLCDAAGGEMYPGHLSRLERNEQTPSVYVAAAIARALGVSLDELLAESEGTTMPGAVSAPRGMVPLFEWEEMPEVSRKPVSTLVSGRRAWLVPPMDAGPNWFALRVKDESMQAAGGVSFTAGSAIFIEQTEQAKSGDFIIAAGQHGAGNATFKQLLIDGDDRFLKALNVQFPVRAIGEDWQIIGVVHAASLVV